MRFIVTQPCAVPRENDFFERFIAESSVPDFVNEQAIAAPWLTENVARLLWVCCELGLVKYQDPYPHKGQTYLPTRAGWIVASVPLSITTGFIAIAYSIAVTADPVKRFYRVRNTVTILTGALLWWRHHELSSLVVAASVAAGIIGTWVASFFSDLSD